MLRSRWAALIASIFVLSLGGAVTASSASAITITTGTVNIEASSPLLGDVVTNLQTIVSGTVGLTTQALCDITQNSTVCSLNVLSYGIATDYKRPNGTHFVRVTGAVVNLPALVDATGDGLPDLSVGITALSTSNIKLVIGRLPTAPATFPVSVEALVNDPSTPNRIINVGYDSRNTTAPGRWIAQASLTTGTTTSINAKVTVDQGVPSSLSLLGGLFIKGNGGARLNPKQARLTQTPVPTTTNLNLSLNPAVTVGTVSTDSPTKADLELLMLDGQTGQHITGTLDKLMLPVSVLLNKTDANGQQTDGTTGNTHVGLTTNKDVSKADFVYEGITNSLILQRVHMATGQLPAQTDFTQTPNGFLADTSDPLDIGGGVSVGVPAQNGQPAVPVPANYPIESNEASYVHQDTTAKVDTSAFRVKGVRHVNVETTGPQENRKIAIGARLASAPLHVLLTNDKAPGGTKYDANINNLPHNLSLAIAPGQTRMIDFCGSNTDAADPCSAAGQADPAGISNITLNPSYAPAPIFGRATHLNGKIDGIPSTLGIDVQTHAPVDQNDPNQNTRVYIDTTRPIGKTLLRATDGTAPPADPSDNGLIYKDTPSKYAVIAKVDGFRSAHLDTDPKLDLDFKADGGHTLAYDIDLEGRHIDGSLPNRPARTHVTLASPDGQPTVLTLDGADANGVAVATPQLLLNMDQDDPIFGDATHMDANITVIPTHLILTIDSRSPASAQDPDQNTKIHVDSNSSIGHILLHATDGSPAPADPFDNGLVYIDKGGKFGLTARVDGFRHADVDTKPKLDLDLFTDGGHDFHYFIDMDDRHIDGNMLDRPARTDVTFGGTPTTLTVAGHTPFGGLAPHPVVTLNMNQDTPLFARADHIQVNVHGIPALYSLQIDTHTPANDQDPDQNTKVHIDASGPVDTATIRASDGGALPADPADNGVIYQDQANKTFAIIAKVDGFENAHLDTKPRLAVHFTAASGHNFTYGIHLPAGDDKPEADFSGLLKNRPKTTDFFFDNQDGQPMEVNVKNFDDNGAPVGIDEITLDAQHLSDKDADPLHNVKVDLVGVPKVLDLTKAPGDGTDLSVTTTGGPVGSADAILSNDNPPDSLNKPTIAANGGGVIVFTSPTGTADADKVFFIHAHVLQLKSVHFVKGANLVADIDVGTPQNFQVYIDQGFGLNYQNSDNVDCQDDFEADHHTTSHLEYHNVFIKNMQPNTHFQYETGDDGNPDPCEKKSWRTIDYSADGRADSVIYNSTAGDQAHLTVTIGQEGDNPLQVPHHLQVCQSGNDVCYQNINKTIDCNGINCDSSDADTTTYLDANGEKTHISLNYCTLNDDPTNFSSCVRETARNGVFVTLNFKWVDMGYAYDTGDGFFSMNTRDNGGLHQVNGFVRVVNDDSAARFINLNFGYDKNDGPVWSAASSSWDQYVSQIVLALPGGSDGDAYCIDESSGPSYDDWNDYFHAVIDPAHILGQDDLGDMLSAILC